MAQSCDFTDVDAYWGKPYVQSLANQGIIAGFPDGTFQPDAYVTRAQFAAMLVHAMQLKADFGAAPYKDVNAKNWAAPAISAAAKAGYVGGFPDGTFHPDEKITRAQALVILAKTLPDRKADEERQLEAYKDADAVPRWVMVDVAKAATDRIVVDYPDTDLIRPQDNATRGELAGMLYQTMRHLGADLRQIGIGLLRQEHQMTQAAVPARQQLQISSVQVSPTCVQASEFRS